MNEWADQFRDVERFSLDADAASRLAGRVPGRSGSGRRAIIGIAGIPGSGKSTLAQRVLACLNGTRPGSAALVPMDGFHLTNQRLEELGLRQRKGSPATFDALRYIRFLQTARSGADELDFPVYDRELHEPVLKRTPGQRIGSSTRFILTEGNYLLLDEPPWDGLADVLDECWFLDTPIDVAERWILARHLRGGRDADDARAHYLRNDLPNAQLVQRRLRRPDLWLQWAGP